MDACEARTGTHDHYGAVEITEIPRPRWSPSLANKLLEKKLLCRWHPPETLREHLPAWYDLCLCCDVVKDGSRRFSPLGGDLAAIDAPSPGLRYGATTQGLLATASLGGEALLSSAGRDNHASRLTLGEARLLAQYVRHMREHLGETIQLAKVLGICRSARPEQSTKHILPPDLGLDSHGRGRPWGPGKLKDEGEHAVQEAGGDSPNMEDIIRLGFLAAALRHPLQVSDAETNGLVRMTLFDLGSTNARVSARSWITWSAKSGPRSRIIWQIHPINLIAGSRTRNRTCFTASPSGGTAR